MRKRLIVFVMSFITYILFFSSPALAVPDLQLYINESEYVGSNPDPWIADSWFTENSSFELWLIVANADITSLNLVMAVPDGETGTVNLTSLTSGFDDGSYSSFVSGTPIMGYDKKGKPVYMPSHGVYDTPYATHSLGSVTIGDDDVYDMADPDTPKDGKIIKFDVSQTGFSRVHFDLYGDGNNAPFSHDAEDGPSTIPEPMTMSLLGMGILGLAGLKGKKERI